MRYRFADLPALARTPVGRRLVLDGFDYRLWRLAAPLATAHRRTLARSTRVVAVVGSLGKTTTARAIEAALLGATDAERRENSFGHVARRMLAIVPGTRCAVVEVGIDRPGQMAAYGRVVRPDVTVVTSVASEHQHWFGTLEAIGREKAEMVAALAPDGLAVLNGDDARVRSMEASTRARTVTFGLGEANDVRARDVTLDWPRSTAFTAEIDGRELSLRLQLLGAPGVRAALAALAVARACGVDPGTAVARLESLAPTPLRLAPARLASGAYLLRDEFKATPESLETALELLRAVPARRRFAVLGDVVGAPGPDAPVDDALAARVAAVCDRVLLVGENAAEQAAALERAGLPVAAIVDCDRRVLRAAEVLRAELRDGDVALLKGRDWQRLERVAVALLDREARCELQRCHAVWRCERCAMLAHGWNGHRVPEERHPAGLVE
jgi:UDP-N-acetylmuramyl pentapeptide synthase